MAAQQDYEFPDPSPDEPYHVPPLRVDPHAKQDRRRKRRFSVSAEAGGANIGEEEFVRKVYPKSQEVLRRIRQSVDNLFLFKGLDEEQTQLILDAMFEKPVRANEEIVTQGDRGDYFYVIERGHFEVWKRECGRGKERKVFEYNEKGAFGELALMYNSPRAATVRAATDGLLWVVDRCTFRWIIVRSTALKRMKYEDFLKDVRLLKPLSDELHTQIADQMETMKFAAGEPVVKQGDEGHHFFLIQEGRAAVVLALPEGGAEKLTELRAGQYFGERALMLNELRSATVVATEEGPLTVVAIDNATFQRVFLGLFDTMLQYMRTYKLVESDDDDSDLSEVDVD